MHQKRLTLNSFLTITVWFPYAFRLLQEFITGKLNLYESNRFDKTAAVRKICIDNIEKEVAQILLAENINVSIFDFRETFQRYAGLTLALQNVDNFESEAGNEKELFRAAGNENVELGAKCLRRRNLNRLKFHQNLSRADIVKMFGAINAEIGASESFRLSVTTFFKLLDEIDAEDMIGEIFGSSSQTINDFAVRNKEKDLWRPREDKQLSASRTPLNLQAMSATATIRKRE